MNKAEQKVAKLKKLYDAGKESEASRYLKELVKEKDPEVLRPLLLMRPYGEEVDNYERSQVMGAIVAFPPKAYVRELVLAASELHRQSPFVFRELVNIIAQVPNSHSVFIKCLQKFVPTEPQIFLDAIERARAEFVEKSQRPKVPKWMNYPQSIENCDEALAVLKNPGKPFVRSDSKTESEPKGVSKVPMSKMEQAVEKLRDIIDEKGLLEGREQLGKLLDKEDPKLIRPLVLMRTYEENGEHLDEQWEIIHAVETFAHDVYIHELLGAAPALYKKSPFLLSALIRRILNTPETAPILFKELKTLKHDDPSYLKDTIQEIRAERIKDSGPSSDTAKKDQDFIENCDKALAELKRASVR